MHTGRRHGREALHDVAMTVGENGSERTLPTVSVAYQLKVNLGLAEICSIGTSDSVAGGTTTRKTL